MLRYFLKKSIPGRQQKIRSFRLEQREVRFVVEDGLKLAAQNIVIDEEGLLVNPSTEERYKPVFNTNGDVWQIRGLTMGTAAQLTIVNEKQ